jgi:hypothetical protein
LCDLGKVLLSYWAADAPFVPEAYRSASNPRAVGKGFLEQTIKREVRAQRKDCCTPSVVSAMGVRW